MKKTIATLLIAAITSVLCFAQETPAITPTELTLQLKATTSVSQIAALEIVLAGRLSAFTPAQQNELVLLLRQAYQRAANRHEVVDGYWITAILPKYVANWNASTSSAVHVFYAGAVFEPVMRTAISKINAAKTPAALDTVVSAYFTTDLLPARLRSSHGPSFQYALGSVLSGIAKAAIRVGHPEALNYALLVYKRTPMVGAVDTSIGMVAAALKAKDFNLARANMWIEGQNTGVPAVTFTDAEKAMPSLLVPVAAVLPDFSLTTAKELYRAATAPSEIDKGIYAVANALKALDLNLARANAWIAAQKAGTPFELP